jgi:hypothetical protein
LRREERRGLWEGFDPASVATSLFLQSFQFNHLPLNFATAGFMTPNPNGGRQTADRPTLADRCASALPWPPVLIAQDAAVDVGSVAGWVAGTAWTRGDGALCVAPGACPPGVNPSVSIEGLINRFALCPVWPPVALTPDASLTPPNVPRGTVVYMDPPYAGTTGYKESFSRDQVCETAERWATAGARVYISEAEPIEALGWHHVEITSERKGQARTFGNTPEWLTCSHRPAWTPPQQSTLFTRPT